MLSDELTDEQIESIYTQETGSLIDDSPWALLDFSRAIEAAATAPLLERIAALDLQVLSALAQADDNWQRVKELERELDGVRKDAERLNHIEKNARCDPKMDGQHVWWPTSFNSALKGPTLRAAIDAALTPPEQSE